MNRHISLSLQYCHASSSCCSSCAGSGRYDSKKSHQKFLFYSVNNNFITVKSRTTAAASSGENNTKINDNAKEEQKIILTNTNNNNNANTIAKITTKIRTNAGTKLRIRQHAILLASKFQEPVNLNPNWVKDTCTNPNLLLFLDADCAKGSFLLQIAKQREGKEKKQENMIILA